MNKATQDLLANREALMVISAAVYNFNEERRTQAVRVIKKKIKLSTLIKDIFNKGLDSDSEGFTPVAQIILRCNSEDDIFAVAKKIENQENVQMIERDTATITSKYSQMIVKVMVDVNGERVSKVIKVKLSCR